MPIWLQDAIVFVVVLGAASVVVRRVVGVLKPAAPKPACDSCALNDAVAASKPASLQASKPVT
jgi:hypothetical protein